MSHKYALWICPDCDDHYRARIANRTAINMGCAACVGQKVHRDGRNSFAKKFPHLVKEWHPENDFGPHEITSGSNKKVKWICADCEHEWVNSLHNRSTHNKACPACNNQQVHLDGRNSLATKFPEIASEWHPDNELKPDSVVYGSSKKVRWLCGTCKHEWTISPSSRTGKKSSGCPACSNKALHIDGRNSLGHKFPEIANELLDIDPFSIVYGSHRRAEWECNKCQHKW